MTHSETAPRALHAKEGFRSFWFLFALSYAVFLVIALSGQLLGLSWRSWLPGAEGVPSMSGGVKAAVYTFMSHLL